MENQGKNAKQLIMVEIQSMYAQFGEGEYSMSLGIGMNHWQKVDVMIMMVRKVISTHQPGTGVHTFYELVLRQLISDRGISGVQLIHV